MRNGGVGVVYLDDPQADPAEVELLRLEQHHVLYMFPLHISGTPVGLLELYSDNPGFQLSEDRMRQVQTLAKIIAIALNNARLYSREQHARLTAEMLRQSAEALNSTLELDRVLGLILEELQQVVHYDSASLMLLEQGYLRIFAVRGHPFPEVALQVRFDASENELSNRVIRRREYLILEDAQRDDRFVKLGKAEHVRGWMGIPMIARDEVIGMLTLDSRTPAAYTPEDAEIALTFASQAALAIHNARLYQSEREQRTLAEVLREISLTLSSTLDPAAILKTLLEQVERVVPYDSACVMLIEGDEVRIAAHRGYERFGVAHLMDDFRMTLSRTRNLLKMTENRQPYFIADVKTTSEWEKTEVDEHVGSWLGAPLIAQERLIGFLSLDKVEPGFYSEWHANRLANLAGHAALALRNALAFGEAERAAITDFLTGAYNHRYFHEEIHHELERARRLGYPVSLLMLDLDRFKHVNDRYGHQIGDRVLQWVVTRLKGELRLTDVLARYGGEEFVIILPGTPTNYLTEVAERLRLSITDQPFQIDNYSITITVSIGGATYPDHAKEALDLIACADRAMYQAKRDGRNCVRLFAPPTVEASH
jgi:diguanylate cyclase (GGDEF)-like protein